MAYPKLGYDNDWQKSGDNEVEMLGLRGLGGFAGGASHVK
jgi:hypothetical protein